MAVAIAIAIAIAIPVAIAISDVNWNGNDNNDSREHPPPFLRPRMVRGGGACNPEPRQTNIFIYIRSIAWIKKNVKYILPCCINLDLHFSNYLYHVLMQLCSSQEVVYFPQKCNLKIWRKLICNKINLSSSAIYLWRNLIILKKWRDFWERPSKKLTKSKTGSV